MAQENGFAEYKNLKIKQDEIDKYLKNGIDFIDDAKLEALLVAHHDTSAVRVREIIAKSLTIATLSHEETATLMAVTDPDLIAEMEVAAGQIKKKVYDNRIVTFAPLYLSNDCVNNCAYCGLRHENKAVDRSRLSLDQVKAEVESLAGVTGHKRLIVVYGEHPDSDIDYMVDTIKAIYDVKVPVGKNFGQIRRVNVNAAPLSVADLKKLNTAGLGTFQVFQETYHHATYSKVHPANTIKGNYQWRLYAMHRAMEAGIDDVGIGALFGLYNWRFEVLGLLSHAIELESVLGIGPHTISFPRMEPAESTPFASNSPWLVSDAEFRKAITVIRLAVPYTGMILTARECAEMRTSLLPLGITQTDASSKIGVGAYAESPRGTDQHVEKQQFTLGDTRSLDDVVYELATLGYITSFCTAGYRCGRTGQCIMDLLRSGQEGKFCKLNAVLTFREWLDDFASPKTKEIGEKILAMEIAQVKEKNPKVYDAFFKNYEETRLGARDLYF